MRVGFRISSRQAIAAYPGPVPLAGASRGRGQTYDLTQTVTLTGVVSRVEWVNPHARLYLDVTRGDGTTLTWSIELGAPERIAEQRIRYQRPHAGRPSHR